MAEPTAHTAIRLPAAWRRQAGRVLARAFQDDPIQAYVLPDPEQRARLQAPLWQAVVGYTLRWGEAYTIPGLRGLACWLVPGQTEIRPWHMLRAGLGLPAAVLRLTRAARRRFLALQPLTDALHRAAIGRPHWYLWALGVEPAAQGQGIGGTLLRPVLARADAGQTPCYLETETAANVAFYRRRGFQVVRELAPGAGLRIWAMIREPAGA